MKRHPLYCGECKKLVKPEERYYSSNNNDLTGLRHCDGAAQHALSAWLSFGVLLGKRRALVAILILIGIPITNKDLDL